MTEPSWVGENVLIPEVDATFGEVVLLNGTLSLKSITRFSNVLARSSVVALDSALRDKLVLDVAAKIDTAFFTGSGAAGVPLGLPLSVIDRCQPLLTPVADLSRPGRS